MINYKNYIISDAEVLSDKPVIKGTRLTVELILQRLSEGASVADLTQAYPSLTQEAIWAVLAYASDVVSSQRTTGSKAVACS